MASFYAPSNSNFWVAPSHHLQSHWYENVFFSHGNRTRFHNKGFAHSLVLKVRVFGTQNAPLKTSGSHLARLCSKENFREPLGLPSILAKVPRPQSWSPKSKFRGFRTPKHSCWGAQASKLVVQVHLMMKKYFVRTLILLACWSPNLVILGFRYDKNLHIILWNPSKFFRHSDSKWETWAMLQNCLGFKEGKVNISTGLHNFHWSLGQT